MLKNGVMPLKFMFKGLWQDLNIQTRRWNPPTGSGSGRPTIWLCISEKEDSD